MTHKSSRKHNRSAVLMRAPFSGDRHTTLANSMLRDPNLSFKARGILSYLGTHKPGWQTSEEHLTQESPDRITSVRSGMAELEEDGYMRRFREREPDGTMGQALWVFSDEPHLLDEFVGAVLADLVNQGRTFVPLTQRTRASVKRKRKPTAAAQEAPQESNTGSEPPPPEPTLENPNQAGNEGFSRSEPTGDYPTSDEPSLEKPGLKKPKGKGEGEEGSARARANEPAPPEQASPWGVSGERKPLGASIDAAKLIGDLARSTMQRGENLTQVEHMELAALLDRARSVVEETPWLSWEEYMGWLWQGWFRASGRRTYRNFYDSLRWRLQKPQITGVAVAWACEQRGEEEVSVRGERAPAQDSDPFAGELGNDQTCVIHEGAVLTSDGRCLACQDLSEPPESDDPWFAPRRVARAGGEDRPSLPGADRTRRAFQEALERKRQEDAQGDSDDA